MREILTRRRLIKLRVSYRKKHKKHPIQKIFQTRNFFVYSEFFAEKTSNVRKNELCIEYFLWETGRAIGRVSVRVPGLRPQHIRSTGNQNLSNRNLRSTESYIV